MNKIDYVEKHSRYIRLPFYIEAFALMIIPFEELLTLPIGSVLRLVNMLTLFICFLYTSKIYIGNRYFGKPIHSLLLFWGYIIISGVWCINRTFYFDRLSTYTLYILLILLLHTLMPNKEERRLMLNGIYVGGIIAAAVLLMNSGAVMDIGSRETIVIFGRMIDPNILAYSCAISFIIDLYYIMFEKKKIGILLIPILIYAILMLGSRGALITCVITLWYMLLKIEFSGNKLLKKILLIVLAAVACFLIYNEVIVTTEFGKRFTVDNLIGKGSLGTANRDKIWKAAIQQISHRPFLGYGNGASMYAIEMVYKYYGTHNSYLMVLLEFGIIGFVLCSIWGVREWKLCKKNQTKIYTFIFFSLMIFVFFVEGFSTKIFWGVQILLMTSCEFEKEKLL